MYYLYNFLAVMLLIFLYCLISSGAISGKRISPPLPPEHGLYS